MADEQDPVRYYPLDVAKLTKGQVFSIEELEKILGTTAADPRWWQKVLNLKARIERLRARDGLPLLTMATPGNRLVILDDEDASKYNCRMGKRGLRRFARASYRNLAVDATKLTDEQAKTHSRTLMRQAMMLAAIRSTRARAISVDGGAGRVTPKMVCGPSKEDQN
jgi:hypothetical protein